MFGFAALLDTWQPVGNKRLREETGAANDMPVAGGHGRGSQSAS
jgi:hypothetical protein